MRVENPKLVVEPGAGRTGKLAMVAYQFQQGIIEEHRNGSWIEGKSLSPFHIENLLSRILSNPRTFPSIAIEGEHDCANTHTNNHGFLHYNFSVEGENDCVLIPVPTVHQA
jgi:hypothetical protein